jgi:hypothetical protein
MALGHWLTVGATLALATSAFACAAPEQVAGRGTQHAIEAVLDGGQNVRAVLLPRVRAGMASAEEARLLQAVCTNIGDEMCVDECIVAVRTAELPEEPHPRASATARVVLDGPSDRW